MVFVYKNYYYDVCKVMTFCIIIHSTSEILCKEKLSFSIYLNAYSICVWTSISIWTYLLLFSHLVMSESLQPLDRSTPGFPVFHYLPKFAQTYVHWVSDAIQPSYSHCLLLLLIFPCTKGFSSESALHTSWPKYWSFSFSINPPNKYSGLISFRIDWFDLLAVQRTLKSLL